MILPGQEIRKRTEMVSPFREKYKFHLIGGGEISGGLSSASYDVCLDAAVALGPRDFKLASTEEEFKMPLDVAGIVHDKSTWARRGISVQNTFLDPGWHGWLTLELNNNTDQPHILLKGTPIAQIVFHLLYDRVEEVYGGKYQNQERGPQEAR